MEIKNAMEILLMYLNVNNYLYLEYHSYIYLLTGKCSLVIGVSDIIYILLLSLHLDIAVYNK